MLTATINADESVLRKSAMLNCMPRIPLQLFGELLIGGEIRLSWNRNGNPFDTEYIIEAQVSSSLKWLEIDRVTRPSFLYVGHRGGIPIKFRVVAVYEDRISLPSNIYELQFGYNLYD